MRNSGIEVGPGTLEHGHWVLESSSDWDLPLVDGCIQDPRRRTVAEVSDVYDANFPTAGQGEGTVDHGSWYLIASLDRDRFQPWVFYYPSGAGLDALAELLLQLFVRLRVEYHFKEAVVVAHSMGGLVTRAFLLKDYEGNGADMVHTYVTISSPLGGMRSAAEGVENSPIVVRSWYGLSPGSPFLDGLFYKNPEKTERRRLPQSMAYHLLFGVRGKRSSDNVVSIHSQLRDEAQEEARTVRGYDEDHVSILASPAVAAHLNAILAALR